MVSQVDADRDKITQIIDLDAKEQFEMFNTDIFKEKISKNNKVFIFGDLSYYDARDLLETLCQGNNKYNGIIMWELQMVQNYDKVVKYDNNISYFNIEIHKACHM